jgi:hypothetical protein
MEAAILTDSWIAWHGLFPESRERALDRHSRHARQFFVEAH